MANRLRGFNLSGMVEAGGREQQALAQEGAAFPRLFNQTGESLAANITAKRTEKESKRRFDEKMTLERDEFSLREGELLERKAERQASENAMLEMLDAGIGQAETEVASLGAPSPKTVEGIKETAQTLGPGAVQRYAAGPLDTVLDLDTSALSERREAARARREEANAKMEEARRAIYSPLVRGSRKAEARAAYNHHLGVRIAAQSEENGYARRYKDAERRETKQADDQRTAQKAAAEVEARKADVQSIIDYGSKHSTPEDAARVAHLYLHGTGDRLADWKAARAELDPPKQGEAKRTPAEQAQYDADYAKELEARGLSVPNRLKTKEEEVEEQRKKSEGEARDIATRLNRPLDDFDEKDVADGAPGKRDEARRKYIKSKPESEWVVAWPHMGEARRDYIKDVLGHVPRGAAPATAPTAAPPAPAQAAPMAAAPAPVAAAKQAAVSEFKALPVAQQTKVRWEQIKRTRCGPGG